MKLNQLTFSRFIAATAIVIFHFGEETFPFNIEHISDFIKYFNVVVSYFFVLSGFILSVNYSKIINLKQFYINRLSRIYPLYLVALLLTLVLIFAARTPKATISFIKVLLSLLLIQSWSGTYALTYNFPAWSLSVEAFFYLIFPFAMYILARIKLMQQILYVITFWFITECLFVLMILNNEYFVITNPLFHLSTFLIGITAGKLFVQKQCVLSRNIFLLEVLSLIFVVAFFYLAISKNLLFSKFYQNGSLAPVFVLFIYTIALSKKKLLVAFNRRWCQYLGEISYGVYILQFPISILVFGLIDRSIQVSSTFAFYIYFVILVGVAALVYQFIEKPCKNAIRSGLIRK